MEEILKVVNVSKTFNLSKKQQKLEHAKSKVKVAVNNLSFTAYKGEIYGLLGPNGAGKTTTLRMISTLIAPDNGEIFIKGIDIKKDPSLARKNIGFLTSDLKLEDFFTPNFLFDFFSNLHGVPVDVREKRKEKLFNRFGIDKFKEVKVGELSTGMRQKASIAISLVHDPEVIIFDEPTNGLDVLTARIVTDYLKELKEEGKTIIISTHIFDLIEKVCDRVGIIINGAMQKSLPIDEMLNGDKLENVFFNLYKEVAGEE